MIHGIGNSLYYGRGKAQHVIKLRQLNPSFLKNVTYKFQLGSRRPLRIEWHENATGHLIIEREVQCTNVLTL